MFRSAQGLLLSLFFGFYAVTAQSAIYSDVFFFGDSQTDTGSPIVNTAVTSPPFSGNTFSDGPAWSTTFANNLGFNDVYGVNNFAVGGAISAALYDDSLSAVGIAQVNQYLAQSGGVADANALYTINIGANDYFSIINSGLTTSQITTNILGNISTSITTLQSAGAQHFLLMDLSDVLSVSPDIPDAIRSDVRNVGLDFQAQFAAEFAEHIVFSQLDFFDGLKATHLDSNGNVGITLGETAATCLNDPVCSANAPAGDSSNFLLFDNVHTTKSVNVALGNAVTAAVVPLPAAFWLFASSLFGLWGWSSRKKAVY
jgi:phospholipase/lecithinase/hemolysin